MIKVGVDSGRIAFFAEGIPLDEPLLDDDEKSIGSKTKSALFGLLLLFLATFSTFAMVVFFIFTGNNGVDLSHNNTGFVFPFEMQGSLADIHDPSSPQFHAMQWMIESDMKVETTSIMERFALAVVFMATNGMRKWKTALGFLDSEASVCDWNDGKEGVFCDADRKTVVEILLRTLLGIESLAT